MGNPELLARIDDGNGLREDYMEAWLDGDRLTPPKPPADATPPAPVDARAARNATRIAGHDARVLAMARTRKPGCSWSVVELVRAIGLSNNAVRAAVARAKGRGEWPWTCVDGRRRKPTDLAATDAGTPGLPPLTGRHYGVLWKALAMTSLTASRTLGWWLSGDIYCNKICIPADDSTKGKVVADLVSRGLMEGGEVINEAGDRMYHATSAGITEAWKQYAKLGKGKL